MSHKISLYFESVTTMPLDIIFDIDHTLVHAMPIINGLTKNRLLEHRKSHISYFFIKESAVLPSAGKKHSKRRTTTPKTIEFAVFIRPGAKQLLQWCYKNANVSFWTSGTQTYALHILRKLLTLSQFNKTKLILARNNDRNLFINVATKQNYTVVDARGQLVKNMSLLFKHADFTKYHFAHGRTFLIDDLLHNYNGNRHHVDLEHYPVIKIDPWYFINDNDDNLLKIQTILKHKIDSQNK